MTNFPSELIQAKEECDRATEKLMDYLRDNAESMPPELMQLPQDYFAANYRKGQAAIAAFKDGDRMEEKP